MNKEIYRSVGICTVIWLVNMLIIHDVVYIGSWVTNISNPINFENGLAMVIVT